MRSVESTAGVRIREGLAPLVRELGSDAAETVPRQRVMRTGCPQETATAQGAGTWSARRAGELAAMPGDSPVVMLLDDESGVVVALSPTLRANGFSICAWTSASKFLEAHHTRSPGCLVTDLRRSGMTGLEVQRLMLARGIDRPVIFISDEGDIGETVLGMRAGAVTVLAKPVQPAALIEAVREAIAKDATMRARRCVQADISARLAQLTARERQVLGLISIGMLNKNIAAELGATEKTIKSHRGRIMDKMRVRTAIALVILVSRLGPPEAEARLVVLK